MKAPIKCPECGYNDFDLNDLPDVIEEIDCPNCGRNIIP